MSVIEMKAYVDENGELRLQLPPEFHGRDVLIRIEPLAKASRAEIPLEERRWADEEIKEMMTPDPKSGAEIAASPEVASWAHLGIKDGVTWVEEMRREEEERRRWPRD